KRRERADRRRASDGDIPEHAVVLQPLRAFDERTDGEPIRTRDLRRDHRELEPGDLIRADPRRGLGRDTVVSRPSGRGRSLRTVAAEGRRPVLAWVGVPRAEVRDLSHFPSDPPTRAGVVKGDGRGGALTRAQRRVAALSVPRRMKSRNARWDAHRWRDAGADARGADYCADRCAGRGYLEWNEGRADEKKRRDQAKRR